MKTILLNTARYVFVALFFIIATAFISKDVSTGKHKNNVAETKKFFIVLETDSYFTHAFLNGKDEWKPEVPYKNYVRIIIAPFEAPAKLQSENGYSAPLRNQLADFIVSKYMNIIEKMKLHNRAFQYSIREYNDIDYRSAISECKDCRYQHERYVLENFKFTPVIDYKNVPNESTKKINLVVSGKEWGKY